MPQVSYLGSCVVIKGVAVPDSFTFNIGNQTFINAVDNYVGSNYTSIVFNGNTYLLFQGADVQLSASSYIKLVNVSYLPILHSVTLEGCPDATTTTSTILAPPQNTSNSIIANTPVLAAPQQPNQTNTTPSITASAVTPTIPQQSYSPPPQQSNQSNSTSNYLWMAMIGSLFIIVPAGIAFTRSRLMYRPEVGMFSTDSLR